MQKWILFLCSLVFSSMVFADTVNIIDTPVYFANGPELGQAAGTIHISQTKYGLLLIPELHHLTPGVHGFHIHENPSCEQNAMAASGHWDPQKTNKHLGPYNDEGHLGDLPALYVDAQGEVTVPVVAVRLHSLEKIKGHALMLHEGGDNYSDTPAKLGGGGTRMLCGVIQ